MDKTTPNNNPTRLGQAFFTRMTGGGKKHWQETTLSIVKSKWFTILLVLIPLFLAGFFRLYPVWLPATTDWAEGSVENAYVSQAEQQLRVKYPLLPPEQITKRAKEEYKQFYKENKDTIDQQTSETAEYFKSRLQRTIEKPDGSTYEQTYMLAIDPYYYLRRAEHVAEQGNVCDEVVDGQCRDNHMMAPYGKPTSNDYHSLLEGIFVAIASIFGIASMTGAFFIPAIFAALATIPTFFIVKKRYGSFAGAIAGIIVGVHSSFLGRTPAGFVDTDVWNVFFPIFIIWLFLLALDRKDNWQYALMAGAGVLTGLYVNFWSGWFFSFIVLFLVLVGMIWYSFTRWLIGKRKHGKDKNMLIEIALIILLGGIGYLMLKYFRGNEGTSKEEEKKLMFDMKHVFFHLGVYVLVVGILVTLLADLSAFTGAFKAPLSYGANLQDPVNANLWPNVLTTVAELNTVSVASIIGQLGGKFLFITALLGIFVYGLGRDKMSWQRWSVLGGVVLYYYILTGKSALSLHWLPYFILLALPLLLMLLYNVVSKKHIDIYFELFTMGWFIAGIFATTQGVRFLFLLLPIMAITIGIVAGWLKEAIPNLLEKELKIPTFYGKIILVAFIIVLLFTPVSANLIVKANLVAKGEIPSMNDAWWNSLTAIKEDSNEDAIITSWWDFGHWFKYVADRRVNFDGASQNTPNAHWVGKLLQTSDEKESIGILRMINCGANNAYVTLDNELDNTLKAYHITKQLIAVSEEEAREVLETEGLSEERTTEILGYTHCTPPDSYLIVSEDMVGKAGVWGHFGTWNFDKAFMYAAYKNLPRQEAITRISEELDMGQGQASQLVGELSTHTSARQTNTWISGWPGYASIAGCKESEGIKTCNINMKVGEQQGIAIKAQNLIVNTSNPENATIALIAQGQVVGAMIPTRLIIDGERYDIDGDFTFGINIVGDMAIIGDNALIDSRFTRLFYLEQPGEYLTMLKKDQQITGGKIIVYKVDWDKYLSEVEG